ncbi:MAG: hypothetical protein C4576_23260, partial [Desulfobacteraceae bacterium]
MNNGSASDSAENKRNPLNLVLHFVIIVTCLLPDLRASGFRLKDCRNDGLWSLFVIPAVFKPESRLLE